MLHLIQLYNADTDTYDFLPTVYEDRTTACVAAQDYIRDEQENGTDNLFYRVIKANFVGKRSEKRTGIVRRIDAFGQIAIPKALREEIGIGIDDPIEIYTDKENEALVLKKYEKD